MDQNYYQNSLIDHPEKRAYQDKYYGLQDYLQANSNKNVFKKQDDAPFLIDQQINFQSLNEYLEKIDNIVKSRENFEEKELFKAQIYQSLINGFNNLIYGYGSKIDLINEIIEKLINENDQLLVYQIKGFKQTLNIKSMLLNLKITLETSHPNIFKEKQDMTHRKDDYLLFHIKKMFKQLGSSFILLLVVHSIDGKKLLNQHAQNIFGQLSKLPEVRILASFDHIRYPQLCKFENILYNLYHTNRCYSQEIQGQFQVHLTKQKEEEGIHYVIKSLNQNQKGIIGVLAQYLISNPTPEGVSLATLFDISFEEMIVSSKQQLLENLREIIEHNIISKKNEKYQMSFGKDLLMRLAKELLDQDS